CTVHSSASAMRASAQAGPPHPCSHLSSAHARTTFHRADPGWRLTSPNALRSSVDSFNTYFLLGMTIPSSPSCNSSHLPRASPNPFLDGLLVWSISKGHFEDVLAYSSPRCAGSSAWLLFSMATACHPRGGWWGEGSA